MSRPLVLLYEPADRRAYDAARIDALRARIPAVDIEYFDHKPAMFERIADAEIVAGEITPEALGRAGRLRWFHTWASGADPLLFPEMIESPVTLTCSRGNGAIPLAEHAMMLMLMLNRNAMRWIRAQDEHRWDRFMHNELNGLTCGIIGLGNSGVDLAQKAKAFHMHVLGLRRSDAPVPYVDEMFRREDLDKFLARTDVLVITAPITPETRGMIGAAELAVMKPTATVVCFSRGGIIDDDALLDALHGGRLAGAGLDAHTVEPLPADSPYWSAPNTIITPHNGAVTQGAVERGAAVFERNLENYLAGRPLECLVDKHAGY